MKDVALSILILFSALTLQAQQKVAVVSDDNGKRLTVNGNDFMVNGMNWDYIPIGTNTVDANFWKKPDDVIRAGLDAEMALLKNMGVNAIRQYTGVPAKWIQYIYENYGIYTMLNHSFGRYGLTIDGVWTPVTLYDEAKTQELLMTEIETLVREYKDTPGILLWLLGNENNYGLFWQGAETEDFPDDDAQKAFIGESRGRPMYKLMNEAAIMMKEIDPNHPVALCNGDVLFIDIIAEECPDVDIYGANTYRGVSFGDFFEVVKEKTDMALLYTEFGADAFNAINNEEDQEAQAYYMTGNWKEIYENAAGLGKAGNSIGGFTFQFSDGWWKFGFDDRENADRHDNNASWENGGYGKDHAIGQNNMNEEWFGICAKGPTNERGLYTLYPRAAYYALQKAHKLDPYTADVTLNDINTYFSGISMTDAMLRARGDKAIATGSSGNKIRLSNLEARFSTYNTGGSLITTPDEADVNSSSYPNALGFDHMQSFNVGVEGNPTSNMRAEVNFNILGNVASNPINEIFYENRGRPVTLDGSGGNFAVADNERIKLYNAEYEWNSKAADVRGFYRTGHYHWGYEGDFFGLYPEANYGPNLDIYQGEISGVEVDAKGKLEGLKLAFGPQLWWGANPAILAKYSRNIEHFDVTAVFHEDIDEQGQTVSSIAIPQPKTRRATLSLEREIGKFGFQLGGIWGGQPLNGREFQMVEGSPGNYITYVDKINSDDNWGAKGKVTYQSGPFNWYAQGGVTGLVARGGWDQTLTYTGWKLKDVGTGNLNNFLSGLTYQTGDFQIAPNFLWQKPLTEAIPNGVGGAARLRNVQDDPFAVRGNRETIAGELLITYDPTPASWFYQWDNDRAEDAPFAANLGVVYRHLPTTMDAGIGFFEGSRTGAAFGESVPAEDLWEVNSRIVSKINPDFGFIANLFTGNGQSNGSDDRVINRTGADVRWIYKKFKMQNTVQINDWGPYDYHRDFNLTYPVQLMTDLSASVGRPDWFVLPDTKLGVRGTWRSLDQYSPRYSPNAVPPNTFPPVPPVVPIGFDNGNEWEIRTYIHINIGK